MASNAEHVSIWWRHHVLTHPSPLLPPLAILPLLYPQQSTVSCSPLLYIQQGTPPDVILARIWWRHHDCSLRSCISIMRATSMPLFCLSVNIINGPSYFSVNVYKLNCCTIHNADYNDRYIFEVLAVKTWSALYWAGNIIHITMTS